MHSLFLRRCICLAEEGRWNVSPNPLVGAVVVLEGQILTEGWHERFGGEHAEVIALKKAGELAHGATLYVSLEPCCTQGKQPPCTDAIIKSGIRRVVFGARDPSNSGSKILIEAGIEVIGPMMEAECRRQNKGFFSLLEHGRPYVTLKKAMTRDGNVKNSSGQPRLIITNDEQDRWAHTHLRATHDAILVGAGTILADNPELTIRTNNYQLKTNNSLRPRRVILDPHSIIPKTAKVLTDEDASGTLIIREKLAIEELLARLKTEGIASVLAEGGPTVWQSFEESGYVDEMVILVGE